MWRQRLESRVRDLVEHAQAGKPLEDSLVELKREWPGPAKASRRIAAHANAARGEEIIWIIGIDEKSGRVHGVEPEELANWWPQVQNRFDEDVAPEMRHIFVSTPHGRLAALAFDTDRGPYVIKVSQDPVTREVPWRDGTRTRTARRSELLKVLLPAASVPTAAVVTLRAVAELQGAQEANHPYGLAERPERIAVTVFGKLYINPPEDRVVLPDYAMTGMIDWNPRRTRQAAPPETPVSPSLNNQAFFTAQGSHRVEAHPLGIEHRHGSVYVNGAGEMDVRATALVDADFVRAVRRTKLLRVAFRFPVAGDYGAIVADCVLNRAPWPTDMGREQRPEDLGVWVAAASRTTAPDDTWM